MEIKRYIALIWRWAWIIILGVIVASGTAFLVSKNTTPVYRAEARFLIDEAPGAGSSNEYSQILTEQRLAQTYVQIMSTNKVMEETISRLELPLTVNQLKSKITVNAPQETQILEISVEDTDAARAANIANTIGQVFIEQNLTRESQRYAEPIANWEKRITEIGDEIEDLDRQISALEGVETPEEIAALSRLETQRNEARLRYTEAFNELNDLQVSQIQESNNIQPIEPAALPTSPIRPRTMSNTLLAAAVGGMLALGIIFLIEYLDDTVKTPDQVMEDTGLSTLGAIAFIKGEQPGDRIITHIRPRDPVSEAYRVLRTNLSFSAIDKELQDVLITSSSPGEGKSTTVANLAAVLAQAGKKVIVVDADLRRPVQHKIFGLPNNQGLTTALLDQKTAVISHIQSTPIRGLQVMCSGPIPPNPAELLNSQRMSQVLAELREVADVIVYDTPPALTVADASILAPQVDGTMLVIDTGNTRRDTFIQAVQRLQKTSSNMFGVVMNRLRPGRSGYYYDYYYYYYHYYGAYEQDNRKRTKNGSGKRPNWLAGLIKR
ncbi:MAG: polysaccharide biosynthesis tyrosine autokinase [Ardenticatenaceae bacterium]|nr:polysaccharide biosynthesis tyrosine autokinase [Anaerolineales bacterium]MCB8921675.1 polysaccharide biosynthesis tyrosine autokinase [Ardenticatenaceae bacterium]MCB9003293.1 polysaccharide biosynthesis tyrosine autokinase [Ardenticatenaceae bacterium]